MSNDTNSGYRNSGDFNSGDYNSGDRNSGDCNSGDCNSGYRNNGYRNSGDFNRGDYNSGGYNSGDCNTDQPTVRIFNHDSGWKYFGNEHIKFRSIINSKLNPLCEWVSENRMSANEKENNQTYKTTGGYLKINDTLFNGNDLTDDEIAFLEAVPNFDAEILLECTGIDITNKKRKLIIDGKEILISKESFEEMKRQFLD